jgi:hypothetical protein
MRILILTILLITNIFGNEEKVVYNITLEIKYRNSTGFSYIKYNKYEEAKNMMFKLEKDENVESFRMITKSQFRNLDYLEIYKSK